MDEAKVLTAEEQVAADKAIAEKAALTDAATV